MSIKAFQLSAWPLAALLSLLALVPLFAQERQDKPATPAPVAAQPTQAELDAAVIAAQKPSYPLTLCPVSGEELGSMGAPIDLVAEGRLIRVCCKGCVRSVTKSPAEAIAKIDAAVIAAQKASYPLTVCPISGNELEADKAVDLVHGTRLVRLCCNDCKAAFLKDPAPVMAKIDAALIEAQRKDYPLETCFISGEPVTIKGEPKEFLYGTELVRLCCGGCKRSFDKNPEESMLKLRAMKAAALEAKAAGQRPAKQEDKPAERKQG